MRPVRGVLCLVFVLATSGCSGARPDPRGPPYDRAGLRERAGLQDRAGGRERAGLRETKREAFEGAFQGGDPLPHEPDPRAVGATGRTVAVTASRGDDQARRLAIRLVRALLDGDTETLNGLFDDAVVRTHGGQRVPRSNAVSECVEHARRLEWKAEMEVEEVADVGGIRVLRPGADGAAPGLPSGIRPDDLVVQVPLRPVGPRPALRCFQVSFDLAQITVRPGPRPVIVGIFR